MPRLLGNTNRFINHCFFEFFQGLLISKTLFPILTGPTAFWGLVVGLLAGTGTSYIAETPFYFIRNPSQECGHWARFQPPRDGGLSAGLE